MKAAVLVFPGSNCDRDMAVAFRAVGAQVDMIWHQETVLKSYDVIGVPGGFTYGDYLRCGAIAARAPVMAAVTEAAKRGVRILGVCNGFQILTELGLLPGVLRVNQTGRFIARDMSIRVETPDTPFTRQYASRAVIHLPVAHYEGNYYADPDTLDRLEQENRVLFRYATVAGDVTNTGNMNGSCHSIAGITNAQGTVLGMMPHPERAIDPVIGSTDGLALFRSMIEGS